MIDVTILNPKGALFEGQAESVVLPGDCGDFELLPFHKAIVSLLRQGEIVLDGRKSIPVRKGVARLRNDQLVALVEN